MVISSYLTMTLIIRARLNKFDPTLVGCRIKYYLSSFEIHTMKLNVFFFAGVMILFSTSCKEKVIRYVDLSDNAVNIYEQYIDID